MAKKINTYTDLSIDELNKALQEKKETLLKKISAKLISEEKVSEELAINSAKEGFEEVERLLANHSEADYR
mgnify:CR=1 FL=1